MPIKNGAPGVHPDAPTPLKEHSSLRSPVGEAALAVWPRLRHDHQQLLFEQAVALRGEPMRHELAAFLHGHHPRTSDITAQGREVPKPDSLGG
jgi:hypothetical protein